MKIKRALRMSGIAILLLAGAAYHFLFGYVVAEQIHENVTVLHRKNILRQIGANVTIYTGSDETLVVDTQLHPLASSTRSKIQALSNAPVTKVVVTHWHPDHSGGISSWSSDSEVIAHDNVLKRLSAPQEGFGLTKPGSHHEFAARSSNGLPGRTLDKQLQFSVGGHTVDVVHYPSAHTDGDLVVFFHESEIVVIGDLIWPNSFPFVDVFNGGSVQGLESALQAIIQQSTSRYRFIPGHGETLSFEDIVEYSKMVTQTRRWVESRLDEGESTSQLVLSELPEYWKQWDSSLVPAATWIEMINDSRSTRISEAPLP